MNNSIEAGLIPNDPEKAEHNSLMLEIYRTANSHIEWTHVRDPLTPDFCFYHLAYGIRLRPGERWTGSSIYTQLYFHALNNDALVTIGDLSVPENLSLVNFSAFQNKTKEGAAITDGPHHGNENARRWIIRNVATQSCGDGLRLNNTWIGSVQDCFLGNCKNGIHVPVGSLAIAVRVTGGEIAGNDEYGIRIAGSAFDCRFSTTIEGNQLGGVLHEGVNGKDNIIYDGCYFESNGFFGPDGSKQTGQPRQFVLKGSADRATKLVNCGFHDLDVPSFGVYGAKDCYIANNWYPNEKVVIGVIKNSTTTVVLSREERVLME